MNNMDKNVFTDITCPHLSGKIIDDIFLVNKHYNKVIKDDKKHLYNLYWEVSCENYDNGQLKSKTVFKDGEMEGERLRWYENGQLSHKQFYKGGKREGEQLEWFDNGQLLYEDFYKDGKREGDQLNFFKDGHLWSDRFFKDGKQEGCVYNQ